VFGIGILLLRGLLVSRVTGIACLSVSYAFWT